MKVLSLLLLAVAVSARPESSLSTAAGSSQELTDSAALPLVLVRRELEDEQIPVHLVYEDEDVDINRVYRVPQSGRSAICSGGQRRERRAIGGHYQSARRAGQEVQNGNGRRRERRAIGEQQQPASVERGEVGRDGGRRRERRAIGGHHQASSGGGQEVQGAGPSIVKLKVRRGGVAIAGPGGVATAGSGGTAIVGPGGTAFTMPDGTAVVGPGGRLIQLQPYVSKGRAASRLIATGPVIYYPLQY